MSLDIEAVSPKAGPQFSPNLYAWLRKHFKRSSNQAGVYRGKDGTLYVGYTHDRDFIGSRLWTVLGTGARTKQFCYLGGAKFKEIKTFWKRYAKLGRCYLDAAHQRSFIDERWKTSGRKRTCRWCGHVQKKVSRKKTVVVHSWVAA